MKSGTQKVYPQHQSSGPGQRGYEGVQLVMQEKPHRE